ncbi:MAG: shikimate dehydrogenase [Candidatus Odinarchaeota archaeon]
MSGKNFVTARTKILCVIGHPIEHSMSPIMHNAAIQDLGLDYLYIAFDIPPNKLKEAIKGLKTLNIRGINVTLPYKEKVMKFIDKVDQTAQKIGAINTIKNEDGLLIGRNTDAEGANKALFDAGCEITGKNVVLIGAGGAAKAILYSLASNTNKITIINRSEDRAKKLVNELKNKMDINIESKKYDEIILKEEISNADILINATPIGMFPMIDITPVSKKIIHKDLFVFDLIYNPLETKLIKDSKEIGCQTLSGLDMLVNQGALAFEWWTNKKPNLELMKLKIIEYLGMK